MVYTFRLGHGFLRVISSGFIFYTFRYGKEGQHLFMNMINNNYEDLKGVVQYTDVICCYTQKLEISIIFTFTNSIRYISDYVLEHAS